MVPNELETNRLLLRAFRPEDFEAFAKFYADEDLARFVGGHCDRHDAWRRFAVTVGHWTLRGFGPWAVEEKSSGKFLGRVGLWQPECWPETELMYSLVGGAQGKGYATEAATCVRDYAFGEFGAKTLASFVAPENEPSRRVAERLGGIEEAPDQDFIKFGDHIVYRYAP